MAVRINRSHGRQSFEQLLERSQRDSSRHCCCSGFSAHVALFPPLDYIRTFTWDKKLEMVVKSTGILGGQGKTNVALFAF